MGGHRADQLSGVQLTALAEISGELGSVLHVISATAPGFSGFGEAYFSTVRQGAIKGWKKHTEMACNLVVPVGEVRFVLFDDRAGSSTSGQFQEIVLSRKPYRRLTIPAGMWFSFEGRAEHLNLVLNVASVPYSPGEGLSLPLDSALIPPYAF